MEVVQDLDVISSQTFLIFVVFALVHERSIESVQGVMHEVGGSSSGKRSNLCV